eukprot:2059951-Prymnesium_polylepis.1
MLVQIAYGATSVGARHNAPVGRGPPPRYGTSDHTRRQQQAPRTRWSVRHAATRHTCAARTPPHRATHVYITEW